MPKWSAKRLYSGCVIQSWLHSESNHHKVRVSFRKGIRLRINHLLWDWSKVCLLLAQILGAESCLFPFGGNATLCVQILNVKAVKEECEGRGTMSLAEQAEALSLVEMIPGLHNGMLMAAHNSMGRARRSTGSQEDSAFNVSFQSS